MFNLNAYSHQNPCFAHCDVFLNIISCSAFSICWLLNLKQPFEIRLATLLGCVSLLVKIFKVKIFYKFKIWCEAGCEVGEVVFYSENRCATSELKRKNDEYLVKWVKKSNRKRSIHQCYDVTVNKREFILL